jgi:hypothetical protein
MHEIAFEAAADQSCRDPRGLLIGGLMSLMFWLMAVLAVIGAFA